MDPTSVLDQRWKKKRSQEAPRAPYAEGEGDVRKASSH